MQRLQKEDSQRESFCQSWLLSGQRRCRQRPASTLEFLIHRFCKMERTPIHSVVLYVGDAEEARTNWLWRGAFGVAVVDVGNLTKICLVPSPSHNNALISCKTFAASASARAISS